MGLAASQARFLGLTARKANCIFKSTQLAQEKLQISNNLADISNEYNEAMSATKLMWCNDSLENDYRLSYSLLMMPSAANDFNPYMITTRSGAIILNTAIADAAKAAGISMNGGVGTQSGRDKFIAALVPGGMITQATANDLTETDYQFTKGNDGLHGEINAVTTPTSHSEKWNATAGVGGKAMDKNTVDTMYLSDMILSKSIGGVEIDWLAAVTDVKKSQQVYEQQLLSYTMGINFAKLSTSSQDKDVYYANKGAFAGVSGLWGKSFNDRGVSELYIDTINKDLDMYMTDKENSATQELFGRYMDIINDSSSSVYSKSMAQSNLMKNASDYPLFYAMFNKKYFEMTYKNSTSSWDNHNMGNYFNLSSTIGGSNISVVKNGTILSNAGQIQELTIGDLLSDEIIIMLSNENAGYIQEKGTKLLNAVAQVLGYNNMGINLNVDQASSDALDYAYNMTVKKFLDARNVVKTGSDGNRSDVYGNSAWTGATRYNRITYGGGCTALNLSNMLSAFLTYYDQSLRGEDSINDGYIVGKAIDSDNEGKNYFVTDNPNYSYVANTNIGMTNEMKFAEFYDELYNSICLHGWRLDDSIDQSEYLENAIKDGRYSMMSLNEDGWFYQTQYNHTGYMQEELDQDAIARAEVEYTRKKAELTYKEDYIDVKTKNLDAEIAELNAEMDTVKQLISKNIEKTFQMYQQ